MSNIHSKVSSYVSGRWFYVGMASLFLLTAIAGFLPTSLAKIAAVQSGERPPLPSILHVHAIAMGAWLALLLVQTVLVSARQASIHRVLGVASFILAPTVFVSLILLVASEYRVGASFGFKDEVSNGLLFKAKSIVLFAIFYLWAILVRSRNQETHKRMIVLATLALIDAALGRMVGYGWLPTLPASSFVGYDSTHFYQLLWLTPALAYDSITIGRPHRAYIVGIALFFPFIVATHILWSNPWWLAIAPKLMGLE